MQIVNLEFNAWSDNYHNIMKLLNGNARSYTFSKKEYSQFTQNDITVYGCGVISINYKSQNKFMIMSETAGAIGYYDAIKNNSIKRFKRTIKALKHK